MLNSSSRVQRSFCAISDTAFKDIEQKQVFAQMGLSGAMGWEDVLQSPRVLIISEAGSGKTYECKAEKDRLWAEGQAAFFIELAQLSRGDLRSLLSPEEELRFDDWQRSQSGTATFFLDSYDELKLTQGSFSSALNCLAKALSGHLGRARIVLTSRPVPFDEAMFKQKLPVPPSTPAVEISKERAFAEVASGQKHRQVQEADKETPPDWRRVYLMPLSPEQIRALIVAEEVSNPDALLAAIYQRNAQEFTQRPLDLIELCVDWRDCQQIRAHREQLQNNIRIKLKSATDRQEPALLSPQKAEEGAERLALACVLTRKLTLRYGVESDRIGAAEAALDPADILRDWDEKERRALLERPLFGIANYGRVRFHHRSVIEYLAAKQLKVLLAGGMATRTLKSLLFAETPEGLSVVRPSMRPIAAWLAAEQTWVFSEILAREPEVVLDFADPESLSPGLRCAALAAYVKRHAQGGWRGMHVPKIQIHRFACPDLAPTILQHWQDGVENPEVRELMIEVVGAGKITACADLVWQVVLDHTAVLDERRAALLALAELKDQRIPVLVAMLAEAPEKWPQKLLKAAILHFFPDFLPLSQVRVLLVATTESAQGMDEMGWYLPQFIAERPCEPGYLNGLRELLTDLILEKAESIQHGWKFRSGRGHLINALATVCQCQVLAGISVPSLFDSIVAAIRLSSDQYQSQREQVAQLKAALNSLPDKLREDLFWADVRLTQQLWPEDGSWQRAYRTWEYGSVRLTSERDAAWAWESLAEQSRALAERWIVLDLLLHLLMDRQTILERYADRFRLCVRDAPELAGHLEQYLQQAPKNPKLERIKRREQAYKEQRLRKEAKELASWVTFWRELSANPDAAFDEVRGENTAWNLWRAASKTCRDEGAGWNRTFLEMHFSKEVADRLRQTLMHIWRRKTPTLPSERPEKEKNTYPMAWAMGLAGIYAEAEAPSWANQLSTEEAALAARYVPLALNEFPAWFCNLAVEHSGAVNEVLGRELSAELSETAAFHSYFQILQWLGRADSALVALFFPRLVTWFLTIFPTQLHGEMFKASERLRMVIDLLIGYGNAELKERVQQEAAKQLAGGLNAPFTDVWLPILFRLSPVDGAAVFVQGLTGLDNEAAIKWFATLFGGRLLTHPVDLNDVRFAPELRLQLLRLAYRYVRPEDDIRREGAYTPGVRDNAERARNKLLDAVLNLSGPSGWAIKFEMANDPLFVHFRDRALHLAKEKAAQDIDSRIYSSADMQALYRGLEAVPANTDELFELMRNRLDDLEDFLLQDASPRELWAQIVEEKLMRREIARVLGERAKGAYTVDQENVTADEKETDIRLNIARSNLVGVIELKLGNKSYSGRDLRDTLRKQLVEKYMQPSNRRAGYLLVTLAKDHGWKHPETRKTLDVEGLRKMLGEEARRIVEQMGYTLRLGIKVLDLRPRSPRNPEA